MHTVWSVVWHASVVLYSLLYLDYVVHLIVMFNVEACCVLVQKLELEYGSHGIQGKRPLMEDATLEVPHPRLNEDYNLTDGVRRSLFAVCGALCLLTFAYSAHLCCAHCVLHSTHFVPYTVRI